MVFYVILGICLAGMVYSFYQLARNNAVYEIRHKWICSDDKRWDEYTYDFMFDPKLHNWMGLRWPKEKNYPAKTEA